MEKKLYRHYGNSKLLKDVFEPIQNEGHAPLKPSGGMWASPIRSDAYTWNDFLTQEWDRSGDDVGIPDYFDFSMKDDAKVLVINSESNLEALPKQKSDVCFEGWVRLDFEELSKQYDAIEVNISNSSALRDSLATWDVDSLLVFNYDSIQVERSFSKYPETLKSIAEEYDIDSDHLFIRDGYVNFCDSTHHFTVSKINVDGNILEKLSKKDFEDEMTGVAKIKAAEREERMRQVKRSIQVFMSIPEDTNSLFFYIKTRRHLDGTSEFYMGHGKCPVIASLDSAGKIITAPNRKDFLKDCLSSELKALEELEKTMKKPQELMEVPIDKIRKIANDSYDKDPYNFVSTDAMLGIMYFESKWSRFPSMDERLEFLRLDDVLDMGEKINETYRKKEREDREQKEKCETNEIDREK